MAPGISRTLGLETGGEVPRNTPRSLRLPSTGSHVTVADRAHSVHGKDEALLTALVLALQT